MKKMLFTLALCAVTVACLAIPAKPGQWKTIRLADGTEVRAELRGDEFLSYWQAADGTRYVMEENESYVVADFAALQRQAMERREAVWAPRRAGGRQARRVGEPTALTTGTHKGIIILVQYQDKAFQEENTRDYFDAFINTTGYSDNNGFVGSVHDYFIDNSNGLFDLTFDVFGPYTLSHTYSYYGRNSGGNKDQRASEMIREACQLADDDVDFTQYDWDGDGEVEEVFVVYAGKGEADGGDANTIWPHMSSIWAQFDGVRVSTYACGSELNGGGIIDGIGTICHEYSHCLGLPDLYDVEYGGNYGMAVWSLMDAGSYNGNGFIPSGYSGYDKMFVGWQQPIELTEAITVTGIQALSEGGNTYIVYNDNYSDEYYIIENRQRTKWDAGQYGNGVLITHVDYDETLWSWNRVNSNINYYGVSNDHQRCTIIPADNNTGLSYADQLAGDLYPYGDKDSLTIHSTPQATLYNTNSYGDKLFYIAISDIAHSGGLASFKFALTEPYVEPVEPFDGFFYESFNRCNGRGGNGNVWGGSLVGVASLSPDNTGWTGNIYGANECASVGSKSGNTIYPGETTTPAFDIDGDVTLSFRAAPWRSDATSLQLSVTGDATLSKTTFTLTDQAWTDFAVKLSGTGSVQLTFTGQGRFFLDEVKAVAYQEGDVIDEPDDPEDPEDPVDPTAIRSVVSAPQADGRIYTLDGRYAGSNALLLRPGIYIRNGKKFVK
ncbi:MAG: M6 family metalloprotease domain-containing protein [Prevotella sp.]|nr:M6 family metalloprotease domain-containing protein [Prevotella sp.]